MLKLTIVEVPERLTSSYSKVIIPLNGRVKLSGTKLATEYNFKEVEYFSIANNKQLDPNDTALYLIPNANPEKRVDLSWDEEGKRPMLLLGKTLPAFGLKAPDQVSYEIIPYDYEGKKVRVIKLCTVAQPQNEEIITEPAKKGTPPKKAAQKTGRVRGTYNKKNKSAKPPERRAKK
jgi:hypothetical protein